MKQISVELLQTRRLSPDHFHHTYYAPEIAETVEPAQFVHIRVGKGSHPILRRPFSICMADKDTIQILFKVVGEGTRILSNTKTGDVVDIMGPIGNSFKIGEKPPVLIAGGIGCAPLYFLARRLKDAGKSVVFLYGARRKNDLVLLKEIDAVSDELKTATDDGSVGATGFVTDLAIPYLNPDFSLYACGPEPMFLTIQKELKAGNLSSWFSLENRMACGVGACLGCSIETTTGYRRVCVDGPVFRSDEIISFPFSSRPGGSQ